MPEQKRCQATALQGDIRINKMKPTVRRILAITAALIVSVSSFAVGQKPTDQDDVIITETDVTNLPFTAVDQQHRFITTLRAEDLRVLEDGVSQQLFTFQRETDRPLSIAFLIDVSSSQRYTLTNEKSAARGFIEKAIQSSKDQVAIIPFTGQAFLELALTRDVISVYRVLQQIEVAIPVYQGAGRPLTGIPTGPGMMAVSYTHLRAHETPEHLVCRLLLE